MTCEECDARCCRLPFTFVTLDGTARGERLPKWGRGWCVFVTSDHRCVIHEDKPDLCRDYEVGGVHCP